jgi:hypothetical protein
MPNKGTEHHLYKRLGALDYHANGTAYVHDTRFFLKKNSELVNHAKLISINCIIRNWVQFSDENKIKKNKDNSSSVW